MPVLHAHWSSPFNRIGHVAVVGTQVVLQLLLYIWWLTYTVTYPCITYDEHKFLNDDGMRAVACTAHQYQEAAGRQLSCLAVDGNYIMASGH